MKQNLPISYPVMIEKFLQDRITNNTLGEVSFDELTFNSKVYKFDILGDGSVVRIINQTDNQIYNITEHDYMHTYDDMLDLNNLLNYIEQTVEFTITDWVESYLSIGDVYSGALIDIYRDGKDISIDINDRLGVFISHKHDSPLFTGGVNLVASQVADEVSITPIFFGAGELALQTNAYPEDVKDFIKGLLNSENTAQYVERFKQTSEDNKYVVNKTVFDKSGEIYACGIKVLVDSENGLITIPGKDRNYVVTRHGTCRIEDISPDTDKNNLLAFTNSMFMRTIRISRAEERYIDGVIKLLNCIN